MAHYFLAVAIPNELQTFYEEWKEELKPFFPYKRWTAKEDLHITLAFLGKVDKEQLQKLVEELRTIDDFPSFPLTLGGLGTFGEKARPRVLFVDVQQNEQLAELQQQIVVRMEKFGIPSDQRPYRPHVTLGKKWNGRDRLPQGKMQMLKETYSTDKQFNVTSFTLFQIHPQQVPSYEAVVDFPLET